MYVRIPCWVIGYLSDEYYAAAPNDAGDKLYFYYEGNYLVYCLFFRVIEVLLYFCQSFYWGDTSTIIDEMKLKEDLNGNTDNAGDKAAIQKQVKQKLLQAQQEEALFVKVQLFPDQPNALCSRNFQNVKLRPKI